MPLKRIGAQASPSWSGVMGRLPKSFLNPRLFGKNPRRNTAGKAIRAAPAAERLAIEGLVEKCLAARGVGCETWEQEINARVARLYGLTKDEIKLVEESVKK